MISTLTDSSAETLAQIREEMDVRQTSELFVLFPLGSQYDHLIVQELGKLGVFCLVADPVSLTADDVRTIGPIGVILSGGPASVYEQALPFDTAIFDLEIPVLGICLGFQLWAQYRGLMVTATDKREFGCFKLSVFEDSQLFKNIPTDRQVLQSHGDSVKPGFGLQVLASTANTPIAAGQMGHLWGVQFHPEVTETVDGLQLFSNFCFLICGARDRFQAKDLLKRKTAELSDKIGDCKVLLALSGGCDSSTVAYLLRKAEIKHIRGIYIQGIDRPDDLTFVQNYFRNEDWLELKIVDASQRFLDVLAGHTGMRDKRLAMRTVYREVLEEEAAAYAADFIAQGTLYTDLTESGEGHGSGKAQIKLHHNVKLLFSLPELIPLADQVKDTGRELGREAGVPEELLLRQPFPGPGLVVRVEGEVTAEKLAIARQVDGIYIEELRQSGLYDGIWQAGAVVTHSITTCTKGDDAVSGYVVALFAVWSVNGFTAKAAELPWPVLKHISQRITNEVREVGAVVYRTSDKPPTTIEWG